MPKGDMSFGDGAALCAAACAGYGLAQMHDYYADDAIAAGALEAVLENSNRTPIRYRLSIRKRAICHQEYACSSTF